MKRPAALITIAAAVLLLAGAALAQTPAAFKVPFAFKIGTKNPAAGAYARPGGPNPRKACCRGLGQVAGARVLCVAARRVSRDTRQ